MNTRKVVDFFHLENKRFDLIKKIAYVTSILIIAIAFFTTYMTHIEIYAAKENTLKAIKNLSVVFIVLGVIV